MARFSVFIRDNDGCCEFANYQQPDTSNSILIYDVSLNDMSLTPKPPPDKDSDTTTVTSIDVTLDDDSVVSLTQDEIREFNHSAFRQTLRKLQNSRLKGPQRPSSTDDIDDADASIDIPELLWSRDEDGRWHPPDISSTSMHTADSSSHDDLVHLEDEYCNFASQDSYKTVPLSIRFLDSTHNDDHIPTSTSSSFQDDNGSNTTCLAFHDRHLMHNIRYIEPISCDTAHKDGTVNIIAIGTIYLKNDDGVLLPTTAYLSKDLPVSIISPNAILRDHRKTFVAYQHYANIDTDTGFLRFIAREGANVTFPLSSKNLLWFHKADTFVSDPMALRSMNIDQQCCSSCTSNASGSQFLPMTINRLSDAASFELWHQRLMHPGINTMKHQAQASLGVPPLKGNAFYKCASCMASKCTKKPVRTSLGTQQKKNSTPDIATASDDINKVIDDIVDDVYIPDALPGQHFHADFGFVRGSEFKLTTSEGKTVTSVDGKNSYCLIVDRATRYCWVYLSDSKEPPTKAVQLILQKFTNRIASNRTFRTDNDQGLNKSTEFRKMLEDQGFTIELTGPDSSDQNVRAERPHQDFGRMMRCALHGAGIGPEFWSFALTHAVHVKNRLWHSSLKCSPYEAFTGSRPDLSLLRIFGSRVYVRDTGLKKAKLDYHTRTGIFLCFSATQKNIYYLDDATGKVKQGRHALFDEAHFTVPAAKAPLAAQTLQRLGYLQKESWLDLDEKMIHSQSINDELHICPLTVTASIPTQGTEESVGYDLFLDSDTISIAPNAVVLLSTGIAARPPKGSYLRVASRSSYALKRDLHVAGGVIDPDYTSEIMVIMKNMGQTEQKLTRGDKIAQLLCENVSTPTVVVVDAMNPTTRQGGFGSTDISSTMPSRPIEKLLHDILENTSVPSPSPDNISVAPPTNSVVHTIPPDTPDSATILRLEDLHFTFDMPYQLELSSSPFDNQTTRNISIWGTHPSLGFDLEDCPKFGFCKLKQCASSTPCARIPRWRSELRGAYLTSINGIPMKSVSEVEAAVTKARNHSEKELKFGFATIDKQAMHSQHGIPQLYHDQLNVVGQHLWHLKHDPQFTPDIEDYLPLLEVLRKDPTLITKEEQVDLFEKLHLSPDEQRDFQCLFRLHSLKKQRKLTRQYLQKSSTWSEWEACEFKQLDDYEAQDTFEEPTRPPSGANLLSLLWVYLIKDDGRKKARCVCNGSKNRRGTVTLAETYASALEQNAARVFWAVTAMKNWTAIGADATNAFAEAGAPVAPLYVYCDEQFRNWYKKRKHKDLKKGMVMKVKKALQGHPESPRLWMELIDKIIRELGLTPCTHEPNLFYAANYNNTGQSILFLKQVDDFAISCSDPSLADNVIAAIDKKMSIKVKKLGLISRFNGVDIEQTRDYIKVFNKTYIEKFCLNHTWLADTVPPALFATPMKSDNSYIRKLEESEPLSEKERLAYEQTLGFSYRQAIGELIYALTTCRPDISFAAIKLSQYSAAPAKIHYDAVKDVIRYLYHTRDDGIYFWREKPLSTMPAKPIPSTYRDNNYTEGVETRLDTSKDILFAATDSDHAGDVTHRRSVSGVVIKLAGGAVLYKTSYQQTIAQSSTEAEFTAAVEAAKYILYLRTLLSEIGLPQESATVLYEDNQGALLMGQAQKPTRRTRHMDTKYFGLQDWIRRDLIIMKRINTGDNYSDAMTKSLGTTLFHRHMNFIMGKIIPAYVLDKHDTTTMTSFDGLYDIHDSNIIRRFISREGNEESVLVSL